MEYHCIENMRVVCIDGFNDTVSTTGFLWSRSLWSGPEVYGDVCFMLYPNVTVDMRCSRRPTLLLVGQSFRPMLGSREPVNRSKLQRRLQDHVDVAKGTIGG
jgi:hypothetical protein